MIGASRYQGHQPGSIVDVHDSASDDTLTQETHNGPIGHLPDHANVDPEDGRDLVDLERSELEPRKRPRGELDLVWSRNAVVESESEGEFVPERQVAGPRVERENPSGVGHSRSVELCLDEDDSFQVLERENLGPLRPRGMPADFSRGSVGSWRQGTRPQKPEPEQPQEPHGGPRRWPVIPGQSIQLTIGALESRARRVGDTSRAWRFRAHSAPDRLPAPAQVRIQVDSVSTRLEHRTSPVEEDPWLHDHADRGHVSLHPGAGLHLEHPERSHVAKHTPLDHGFLDLDVGPHQTMLADLEALAIQDVTLELAFDPQRAGNHQGAPEARAHADGGIGRRDAVLLIRPR